MTTDPYVRRCRVVRVIDGDTCDVALDLGYYLTATLRVRLLGIDAPEREGETRAAGDAATAKLVAWVALKQRTSPETPDRYGRILFPAGANPWPLALRTEKADVFGRWLAEIWSADGERLVEALA